MEKHIIRTSDRSDFRKCRQYWDFTSKIRMNYEPVYKARALDFGTAFHRALEVYYDPMGWTQPLNVKVAAAHTALKSKLKEQFDAAKDDSGYVEDEIKDRFAEDLELGAGMLEHYVNAYSKLYDADWKPLHVEYNFEVPITDLAGTNLAEAFGSPVVYQGTIDMIAKYIPDGTYWLWDHKTRGKFDSTDHYEMDTQASSYIWAAQQDLDIKIEGVVFNEIKKSYPKMPKLLSKGGLSKDKNQSTTYELYRKAIQEQGLNEHQYAEFLEYLRESGPEFVRRIPTYRGSRQVDVQHSYILNEAIDMLTDPRIYPNPGPFNCNGCMFKSPCQARIDGADYKFILDNDQLFVRRGNGNQN